MAYIRENPKFSLCGLNCCLCPRYHTEGTSRCPGCGAKNFQEQHPPCGIIGCAIKHEQVSYCFECQEYPCKRYLAPNEKDSFISYVNRNQNMAAAKADCTAYNRELATREAILKRLLADFNEGRSKSFFCIAVDRLPIAILQQNLQQLEASISDQMLDKKARSKLAKTHLMQSAEQLGISLVLRK